MAKQADLVNDPKLKDVQSELHNRKRLKLLHQILMTRQKNNREKKQLSADRHNESSMMFKKYLDFGGTSSNNSPVKNLSNNYATSMTGLKTSNMAIKPQDYFERNKSQSSPHNKHQNANRKPTKGGKGSIKRVLFLKIKKCITTAVNNCDL